MFGRAVKVVEALCVLELLYERIWEGGEKVCELRKEKEMETEDLAAMKGA